MNSSSIYDKIVEMNASHGCGIHIFFEPNIFYIHTSKTGGTSIHKMLKNNFKSKEQKNNNKTFRYVADNWDIFFSFIFVRNIFDKIVSEFHQERKGLHNLDFDSWLSKVLNRQTITHPLNRSFFADFSNQYNEINQVPFVLLKGELYLKYIGKFESFDKDVQYIKNCLKIQNSIEFENKTKNEKHKMNKDQISLISKHFANEIAYFNFTFMQK